MSAYLPFVVFALAFLSGLIFGANIARSVQIERYEIQPDPTWKIEYGPPPSSFGMVRVTGVRPNPDGTTKTIVIKCGPSGVRDFQEMLRKSGYEVK